MSRDLSLTALARRDIEIMARDKATAGGEERHIEYMAALAGRMLHLKRNPFRGRPPKDARSAWSIRSGRHIVLYDVYDDRIVVLRVLHERRDIDRLMASVRRT